MQYTKQVKEKEVSQGNQISGILFFRSVRSTFVSLSLAPIPIPVEKDRTNKEQAEELTLVRLQFFDQVKELRSFFRRTYKLGDIIDIQGSSWKEMGAKESTNTAWVKPRLVINFNSIEEVKVQVQVRQAQFWQMKECQIWQNRFFKNSSKQTQQNGNKKMKRKNDQATSDKNSTSNHGGGLGKRIQGEKIANFLIHSVMHKISLSGSDYWGEKAAPKPSEWAEEFEQTRYLDLRNRAITMLNSGAGVLDVAGGSGHVSMALGLVGVKSTVVDARSSIGKLPRRDRKTWNRAMKKLESNDDIFCQPVVPFGTHRAWFGSLPNGVDRTFRHPDEEEIRLCDNQSELVKNASAIVALHPDEATGDIVHIAVDRRLPFVVVPCCVFGRLFPHRRISNDKVVSSYEDLLEYIKEQDNGIQEIELPFQGKNVVLWSTF
jgi:hypothetical protein